MPVQMEEMLSRAGFADIQVFAEKAEFFIANKEDYWAFLYSAVYRGQLETIERMVGPDALNRLKDDVFKRLKETKQPQGLYFPVHALLTTATKPEG